MRISATGNNPLRRTCRADAGFTLVELLVVLVIAGLAVGAVMLTLPDGSSPVATEAERLAARLTLAGEESISRGQTIGVILTGDGYGFARFYRGDWQRFEGDRLLGDRRFEDGVLVTLTREGSDIPLKPALPAKPGERVAPVLLFEPFGAATPFRVTLSGDGAVATVTGDDAGQIEVRHDVEG